MQAGNNSQEEQMKNILLVDDDIGFLYILKFALKTEGFNIATATNGVEALEVLKRSNFDIMITDFNMPKMNGVELTIAVKQQLPEIPVIMITGDYLPEVIESASKAGISLILPKPFKMFKLLVFIREEIRKR